MTEPSSRPVTVYRFYDAEWQLIYVGISANAPIRFEQHRTVKPWWREVAFIRCDHFATRNEALLAETNWIRQERPRYNLAGFEQFILDRQRSGRREADPEPIDPIEDGRPPAPAASRTAQVDGARQAQRQAVLRLAVDRLGAEVVSARALARQANLPHDWVNRRLPELAPQLGLRKVEGGWQRLAVEEEEAS